MYPTTQPHRCKEGIMTSPACAVGQRHRTLPTRIHKQASAFSPIPPKMTVGRTVSLSEGGESSCRPGPCTTRNALHVREKESCEQERKQNTYTRKGLCWQLNKHWQRTNHHYYHRRRHQSRASSPATAPPQQHTPLPYKEKRRVCLGRYRMNE